MELSQLRTFKIVAETLSFTEASRRLGLTQPAVSHQIKSLEKELGEELFLRDKRRVSLSENGDVVLNYANRILSQVESMRREVADPEEPEKNSVVLIANTRSLGNPFFELRRVWAEANKDIEIMFISETDSMTLIDSVLSGKADVAFSTYGKDFEGLISLPYGKFDFHLVAGSKSPFADKKKVTFSDLENERWILFEAGSWARREINGIFERAGFRPYSVYETNDGSVIRRMVEEGTGVSLLPEWGIRNEVTNKTLNRIEIDGINPSVPLSIYLLKDGRHSAVSRFVTFLLDTQLYGITLMNQRAAERKKRRVGN